MLASLGPANVFMHIIVGYHAQEIICNLRHALVWSEVLSVSVSTLPRYCATLPALITYHSWYTVPPSYSSIQIKVLTR